MRAPAAYLMRSASVIRELDPILWTKATELVTRAYERGIPVIVASGLRSREAQRALYEQGRTTPGAIVTNIRPGRSKHESGLAFDVAPLDPNAAGGMGEVLVPWPTDMLLWTTLGLIGESLGLRWGGRFKPRDFPHFEIP